MYNIYYAYYTLYIILYITIYYICIYRIFVAVSSDKTANDCFSFVRKPVFMLK